AGADELDGALLELAVEIARGRIEGVIEIEDPRRDPGGRRSRGRGPDRRSTFEPLESSLQIQGRNTCCACKPCAWAAQGLDEADPGPWTPECPLRVTRCRLALTAGCPCRVTPSGRDQGGSKPPWMNSQSLQPRLFSASPVSSGSSAAH